MAKTKEEKRQYCREWRLKNRERYLAYRRKNYLKNVDSLREKSKERARKYYYGVALEKNKANPEKYKKLVKIQNDKRLAKRRETLRILREDGGGKCVRCGYCEVVDILQFHHNKDAKDKLDNVTNLQSTKKMIVEAKKCILLCPNCHALTHLNK